MRKILYFLIFVILLSAGIVVGLHFSGYLLNSQRMIPPSSSIDWKNLEPGISDNTSSDFPLILNLTEKMKDIPGIENIHYEIFVSNDSRQQVVDYYKDLLENDGYAYHDEYSGIQTYETSQIYYYTFIKGLNAVVIYVSEYNEQTWICYSTSDILHYKEIFDYMTTHNIIS